jgi:DOMON domain/Eukaryotic cytochrome b561
MRIARVFCVLVSFVPFLAFGVTVDGEVGEKEYQNLVTADGGNYSLSWSVEGEIVYFGIFVKTTGWVGLGIDSENAMQNADMAVGWIGADGSLTLFDAFATGPYGPHPPDETLGGKNDIIEAAGRESRGATVIEFSRPLAAGDEYDKAIAAGGGNRLIWAYSDTDDTGSSHIQRGTALLVSGSGQNPGRRIDPPLLAHIVAMGLSFSVMSAGMLIARSLKKRKWWLKVHRIFGIAGAALGALGLGTAAYMVAVKSGIHLRVVHSWIGLFAVLLTLLSPVFGQSFLKAKKERKPFFRHAHRWVGRSALLVMLATIVLGLFQAGIL